MNQIIRKQEKTEQGLKSINKQMESEGERYERLVAKVNNVTGISETLLRDVTDIRAIFSNFKILHSSKLVHTTVLYIQKFRTIVVLNYFGEPTK